MPALRRKATIRVLVQAVFVIDRESADWRTLIALYLSNSCFRQSVTKLRWCFDVYFQQIEIGESLRKGKAASKAEEELWGEECTKATATNLWQRTSDNRPSVAIVRNSFGKSDFKPSTHCIECLCGGLYNKRDLRFWWMCDSAKANVSRLQKSKLEYFLFSWSRRLMFFCILNIM